MSGGRGPVERFTRRGAGKRYEIRRDSGEVVGTVVYTGLTGGPDIKTDRGAYRVSYRGQRHARVKDSENGRTVLTLGKGMFGYYRRIERPDGESLDVRYVGKLRDGMTMDLVDAGGACAVTVAWRPPVLRRTLRFPLGEASVYRTAALGGDNVLLVALAFMVFQHHLQPRARGG